MAFCASLRRRPSFASIVPALATSGQLKEHELDGHDVNIPLRSNGVASLYFLLLSSHATQNGRMTSTIDRVRRFADLTGCRNAVVIFLLNANSTIASMEAFASLQSKILASDSIGKMQILPLVNLTMLPSFLNAYASRFLKALAFERTIPESGPSCTELIQACLGQQSTQSASAAAYFVADTFSGLGEFARACCRVLDGPARVVDNTVSSSPYFSSSFSMLAAANAGPDGEDSIARKLRKLEKFDERSVVNAQRFWRTERPLV